MQNLTKLWKMFLRANIRVDALPHWEHSEGGSKRYEEQLAGKSEANQER